MSLFEFKRFMTFIKYLHRLALKQGEVKSCSTEEGLAFEAIKGPKSAGGSFAQQLNREMCLYYDIKWEGFLCFS